MKGGLARWRVRAGYPTAVLYFWLAHPRQEWLAAGTIIGLGGLAVRGLAAGYLRKQEGLTTAGPYARTRNPLYFGSALLALGLAVAAHSYPAAVIAAAYFLAFYPATMRNEEAELDARYGVLFREYAGRVPLFWPRPWLKPLPQPAPSSPGSAALRERFSWALYRRNHESNAAAGMAVAVLLLALKMVFVK